MENVQDELVDPGEMHKDREVMPDGKRYIIYYTFYDEENGPKGKVENV